MEQQQEQGLKQEEGWRWERWGVREVQKARKEEEKARNQGAS